MWTRVSKVLVVSLVAGLGGCESRADDPPIEQGEPSAIGDSTPLHVLQDPTNDKRLKIEPAPTCAQSFSTPLTLQGASVNWVDRYDETGDGAVGTVWIQDYNSQAPWSGSSIFSPSFVPSSLYIAAGDLIDLRGLYQVNVCIGSKVDFQQNGGSDVLSQVATPVATFRFEGAPTVPVEVPIGDFDSFETGRKWIGMLVTIRDVTVSNTPTFSDGRLSAPIGTSEKLALSNEFQDVGQLNLGMRFSSLTGVVTWFFSFKLATRTPEDLVRAQ